MIGKTQGSVIYLLVICLHLIACDQSITENQHILKVFTYKNSVEDQDIYKDIYIPIPNIISAQIMLIQLKITSTHIFQAYIRDQTSQKILQLHSIDAMHFYAYHDLSNKNIDIIILNSESKTINDSNDADNLNNNKQDVTSYSIEIIPFDQRTCPFDCFSRGVCQYNGFCLCDEGYSQHSNCQINADLKTVQFDRAINIFNHSNQQDVRIYGVVEEWKYTKIIVQIDEYIQKQIEFKQSIQMKPESVNILFKYKVKGHTRDKKLILLDKESKSYQILDSQDDIQQDIFIAMYNMKYSHFLIESFINQNKGISLMIGHRGIEDIEIIVRVDYKSSNYLFELISIICMLVLAILILSFLVLIVRKQKHYYCLVQEISPIADYSLDSISMQLTQQEMNNQIQNLMPSYSYKTPHNIDGLNQTYIECYICLNTYQDLDECRITKCGHIFHKDCLDIWLHKNFICPLDRVNLSINI